MNIIQFLTMRNKNMNEKGKELLSLLDSQGKQETDLLTWVDNNQNEMR